MRREYRGTNIGLSELIDVLADHQPARTRGQGKSKHETQQKIPRRP